MSANLLFVVLLVISVILSLALQIACVRWGLRWAKVADVTYLKAIGLFLLFVIAGAMVGGISGAVLFATSVNPSDFALDMIGYASQFIASCLVIATIYKARLTTAMQASIPLTVAALAFTLTTFLLIRPFAYESFFVPTNAMAPTILGQHWEAPCPRCGQPAYGAPLEPGRPFPAEGLLMNCSAERRSVLVTDVPRTTYGGDRILVCKFIAPRRWDLMVFRYPANPNVNYVMRLVALPNEELSIRDGAVWINGDKLTPPKSIHGINYAPTIEHNGRVYSGPGSVPVKLGPDEYFVLGDFMENSSDSRLWEAGAPGYPPYAVPESHITGVAINIWWPPGRWTSFR